MFRRREQFPPRNPFASAASPQQQAAGVNQNPVYGRSVQLPLNAAGTALDTSDGSGWRDLLRIPQSAETMWQVTVAPITQVRQNPGTTEPFTGTPLVRLGFGGGGTSAELMFNLPALGVSFVLPAEVVTMDVRAASSVALVAGSQAPVVSAWAIPNAVPTFRSSLFTLAANVTGLAPFRVLPFTKRFHVADSTAPGAGFTRVMFYDSAGALSWQADFSDRCFDIAVPGNAIRAEVTAAGAGNVRVMFELAFT